MSRVVSTGATSQKGIVGAEQAILELAVNASNQPVVDNISTGAHEPRTKLSGVISSFRIVTKEANATAVDKWHIGINPTGIVDEWPESRLRWNFGVKE